MRDYSQAYAGSRLPVKIVQQKVTIREPVITNMSNYEVIANAVIFNNKGATTVLIDRGWQLAPGESVAFSASDSPFTILAQNFQIQFTGAGANLLQVAVVETANYPEIGQYVENLNIR